MNRSVYFLSQYAAPYKGNFIASLERLETLISKTGYAVVFVFPENAKESHWMFDFQKLHDVHFTTNAVYSRQCVQELKELFHQKPPCMIHTHFDGYDISSVKAGAKWACKIVWHLHNPLSFVSNPLKKLYEAYRFFRHYGFYGRKGVYAIAVSEAVSRFVQVFGFPKGNIVTLTNGIDTRRLISPRDSGYYSDHETERSRETTRFLAFGGRNQQKRIDLLLRAATILSDKVSFEVWITKGTDTCSVVESMFSQTPPWLKLITQTNDVAQLFRSCDCFISCSDAETFSYAIAEACYSGLPVIQSDIEGTAWNKSNPGCITFRASDSEALADCMYSFCRSPRLTHDQVCAISDFIASQYSLDAWADSIMNFYICHKLI